MSEPVDLSTRDLAQLTNELKEVIDPHRLGIKLGIEPSTVAQILRIQDVGNTTERQKSEILDHWLKNDLNASWPTLVKALKEMDHKRLAERLEKTYCSQEAKDADVDQVEDDSSSSKPGYEQDHMGKRAEILDSEEKATREFAEFSRRASDLMEKDNVRLSKVKLTWKEYKKGELSEEASKASDITSFLAALSGSHGPYAYRNLSALLISFCGKKGKELVAEYEQKLKLHLQPRVIPTQQGGKRFIVKVDGKLDLTNELDFRITLANLFKCSPKDFILEDIRTGCTELTYIIPSEVADSIQACIDVCIEDFKNAKILQLTMEGQILWSVSSEQTETEKETTQKKELASDSDSATNLTTICSSHEALSGASPNSSGHVPPRFALPWQDDMMKEILEKLNQIESSQIYLATRVGDLELMMKHIQLRIEDKEEVDKVTSVYPTSGYSSQPFTDCPVDPRARVYTDSEGAKIASAKRRREEFSKRKWTSFQPSDLPNKACDQEVILWLADKVTKWKFIGRRLGLEENILTRIETQNPKDVREQCYQMFQQWKSVDPKNFTYIVLGDALRKESLELFNDYVEKVSELSMNKSC